MTNQNGICRKYIRAEEITCNKESLCNKERTFKTRTIASRSYLKMTNQSNKIYAGFGCFGFRNLGEEIFHDPEC